MGPAANSSADQRSIRLFGEQVIPALRGYEPF